MYYLTADQRRRFAIIGWLDWMQTFITITFCKISICIFLLRIKNTRWNVRFMHALIAANVVFTVVVVGLFVGICSPPAAYWTIGLDGRCFSNERVMAIVLSQGRESLLADYWYEAAYGICSVLCALGYHTRDYASAFSEGSSHKSSH